MSLLTSSYFRDFINETYGKDSYTSMGCAQGDDGLYHVDVDLKDGRRLAGVVTFTGVGIEFIKPLEERSTPNLEVHKSLHTVDDMLVAEQLKQEGLHVLTRIIVVKNNQAHSFSDWIRHPDERNRSEDAIVTVALAVANNLIKAADEPYVFHVRGRDSEHLDLLYNSFVQLGFNLHADVKLLSYRKCKDAWESYIEITDPLAHRLEKLLEKQ